MNQQRTFHVASTDVRVSFLGARYAYKGSARNPRPASDWRILHAICKLYFLFLEIAIVGTVTPEIHRKRPIQDGYLH